MCLLCSPVFLYIISQQAHILPKHTSTFSPPGSPDLNFHLRCFQLHVLFQGSHRTSWLPAQKQQSNVNSEDILNLKDINAVLSCSPVAFRLALTLLGWCCGYWGAAATAQRSGEIGKVKDNFTFSVIYNCTWKPGHPALRWLCQDDPLPWSMTFCFTAAQGERADSGLACGHTLHAPRIPHVCFELRVVPVFCAPPPFLCT